MELCRGWKHLCLKLMTIWKYASTDWISDQTFTFCQNILVSGINKGTNSTMFCGNRSAQKYPSPILRNIWSIELLLGRVALKMQKCLFNLLGISFRPPPGWIMAASSWISLMYRKSPSRRFGIHAYFVRSTKKLKLYLVYPMNKILLVRSFVLRSHS